MVGVSQQFNRYLTCQRSKESLRVRAIYSVNKSRTNGKAETTEFYLGRLRTLLSVSFAVDAVALCNTFSSSPLLVVWVLDDNSVVILVVYSAYDNEAGFQSPLFQ